MWSKAYKRVIQKHPVAQSMKALEKAGEVMVRVSFVNPQPIATKQAMIRKPEDRRSSKPSYRTTLQWLLKEWNKPKDSCQKYGTCGKSSTNG